MSLLCIHVFLLAAYTCNRCIRRRGLVEIERVPPEDQEANAELEVQSVEPGEPEEVVECPCHELSTFLKGKPWSIISLLSILLKLEF
jgi:hypothetical protein